MTGYSGTPLAKKLGLKPPLTVWVSDAPEDYAAWLGELPAGVSFPRAVEVAHLFVSKRAVLEQRLAMLRTRQLVAGRS